MHARVEVMAGSDVGFRHGGRWRRGGRRAAAAWTTEPNRHEGLDFHNQPFRSVVAGRAKPAVAKEGARYVREKSESHIMVYRQHAVRASKILAGAGHAMARVLSHRRTIGTEASY
ncbi:MAG: hypothetical protein AAB834_07345 [Patescibacteria group bacterium]